MYIYILHMYIDNYACSYTVNSHLSASALSNKLFNSPQFPDISIKYQCILMNIQLILDITQSTIYFDEQLWHINE